MKPAPAGSGPGALLIIGGHEDKRGERVILKEVARRARGGSLLVATVASHSQADELWRLYRRQFTELGVERVEHLDVANREQADRPENLALLDHAAALFFTGGNQLRITSRIGGTALFERMRRFHQERGGLVAGTSAGAAMMPDTMLVAGRGRESMRAGDRLAMAPGLGFLKGVIVDQHFAERGRMSRLLAALAHQPGALGIGIDEDTAVLVEHPSALRVLGAGAVYVLDASGISYSNLAEAGRGSALAMCDVRLHVLGTGLGFDLQRREPLLPPASGARLADS